MRMSERGVYTFIVKIFHKYRNRNRKHAIAIAIFI